MEVVGIVGIVVVLFTFFGVYKLFIIVVVDVIVLGQVLICPEMCTKNSFNKLVLKYTIKR